MRSMVSSYYFFASARKTDPQLQQQNDCELVRDRDLGLAEPVALDELHYPGLHGGPFRDAGQQNPGRFK